MSKRRNIYKAISAVQPATGAPHWMGIICGHDEANKGQATWIGAVFTDPDDDSSPSYFMHSYGKWRTEGVKLYGIDTDLDDVPDKVKGFRVRKADEDEQFGLTCPHCGYDPDVLVDELVDVAALWVKSVFGPTVDLYKLPDLADRWAL